MSLPGGQIDARRGTVVIETFRIASAGKQLHDDFADKAAAIDSEMVDVINNMSLARAFGGLDYEHERFDATVNRELTAMDRSLPRLRHATAVILTIRLGSRRAL